MSRPGGLRADLDALAELGWGPDKLDSLAGFEPGQFAGFMALDRPVRQFVLKVLDGSATDADYRWFDGLNASKVIAEWMLELPAFQGDNVDEE